MRFGLLLASGVVVLDQASKWLALRMLADGPVILLPGFFDFVLVHNLGAAFGLFTNLPATWRVALLAGVALAAMALLIHFLRHSHTAWNAVALGLVLGGAVGNLVDRIRWGWVVDFIHVHWHDLSWPVFNIADSGISVGITMLLWDSLRNSGDATS